MGESSTRGRRRSPSTSASPLGIHPPLVIRAAPVVVVVVGREQDVEDGAAGASNERVTVTLAGVQARHVRRGYDERRASPPTPPDERCAHGILVPDALAGQEGAPLTIRRRRRGTRTRGSIVFLDNFEGRAQHQQRTPRIPVVAIVVIDDGIAIDVHPIKIAVEIVQHPAEHDHVRMVVERHARVGGEDEYPRRVPPRQETHLCPSLRHKRSAESVAPIPGMVFSGEEGVPPPHSTF